MSLSLKQTIACLLLLLFFFRMALPCFEVEWWDSMAKIGGVVWYYLISLDWTM